MSRPESRWGRAERTGAELGVRAAFGAARAHFRSTAPRILALLAAWAGVWVALEILVFASRSPPGRPIWLALHLGYFWGTSYLEAAILRVALAACGGREPDREVFRRHRLVLRFLAVKLILLPAILVGTALLVVPGLYLAGRYGLAPVAVADQGLEPVAALRRSDRMTCGRRSRLMRIFLALGCLNLGGAALLGLGLLVTVPMTALAVAWIYEILRRAAS